MNWWPFKKKEEKCEKLHYVNPIQAVTPMTRFYMIERGEDKKDKVLSRRKFKKGMNKKEYTEQYKVYRYTKGNLTVRFDNDIATRIATGSYDEMCYFKAAGLGLGVKLDIFLELNEGSL